MKPTSCPFCGAEAVFSEALRMWSIEHDIDCYFSNSENCINQKATHFFHENDDRLEIWNKRKPLQKLETICEDRAVRFSGRGEQWRGIIEAAHDLPDVYVNGDNLWETLVALGDKF